jgi:hypothetical protein
MPSRPKWSRRVAVPLGLTVALTLPIVVLCVGNIALNTVVRSIVNPRPDRVRITYDYAWMVRPGVVHVRGFAVRVQSDRDQWQVATRSASGRIGLDALGDHQLVVTGAIADGASIRYRARLAPGAAANPGAPEIPGLGNPPEPTPPPRDPARVPWRIDIVDVLVRADEIWIEDQRYDGEATIAGDLVVSDTIASRLDVDLWGGALTFAGSPVATAVEGNATLRVADLPRGTVLQRSALRFISGNAHLSADVGSLGFLRPFLEAVPWLALQGSGTIVTDVGLESGAVAPGSRVVATLAELVAQGGSYRAVGSGSLEGWVTGAPATSEVVASFGAFTVTKDGGSPLVEGVGLSVGFSSPDTSLAEAFTRVDVVVDLPPSVLPDVGRFNGLLPTAAGLRLDGGTGTVAGRLEASSDGTATGRLSVTGDDLRATWDDVAMTFDLDLDVHLAEGRILERFIDFSGTRLALTDVGFSRRSEGRAGTWWATVEVPAGVVAAELPVYFDAELRLRARDSAPFLLFLANRKVMPDWLSGALDVPDVSGGAHLLLTADSFEVRRCAMEGGKLELRASLARTHDRSRGAVFARFGKLSFGVAFDGAEQRVRVFGARDWYAAETGEGP